MPFKNFLLLLFLSIAVPVVLIFKAELSAEILAGVSSGTLIFFVLFGGYVFFKTSHDFSNRIYELDRQVADLLLELERVRDMAEMHENTLTENLIFPKD